MVSREVWKLGRCRGFGATAGSNSAETFVRFRAQLFWFVWCGLGDFPDLGRGYAHWFFRQAERAERERQRERERERERYRQSDMLRLRHLCVCKYGALCIIHRGRVFHREACGGGGGGVLVLSFSRDGRMGATGIRTAYREALYLRNPVCTSLLPPLLIMDQILP